MNLVSINFLLFAALVVLLYYILPKRVQWLVLLAASIAFYLTYGWQKLPFLLASAVIAYFAGLKIEQFQVASRKDTAAAKKKSRPVLLTAVALLVALLIYAKIGTWVIRSVARLFSAEGTAMEAIVALGVSYYTFSLISYLADIYRRQDRAEHDFLRLLLFTIYFPKVLQGPISRHKNLAPQLKQQHSFDYKEFCFGLQLMVWGYFKKMVIADRLAIFVDTVFGNIAEETGAHLLVAVLFASIQAYCDFSGCMDIVGGFSQTLGLKLEENFNHPFFSRSAAEFWRRWHITLGTWFKDYIYMPIVISPRVIGLSKKVRDRFGVRSGKAVMTVVPLAAVWLLTGLWHGTGWNYIVWGVYWGALIICSTVFAPELKKLTTLLHINTEAGSWKVFQMVRTFGIFMFSTMITRPGSLYNTLRIGKRLLLRFHPEGFFDGSLYALGLDRPNFILALVCIGVLWAVSHAQEKGVRVRERIAGSNVVFRWAIYYAAVFAVLIFGVYGPGYDTAAFMYIKF